MPVLTGLVRERLSDGVLRGRTVTLATPPSAPGFALLADALTEARAAVTWDAPAVPDLVVGACAGFGGAKAPRGAVETTAGGVERLRRAPFPVIAVAGSSAQDRYGTAQAAVRAILRLTNMVIAGRRVAVLGYRRELAVQLKALGARTIVVETEPVGALEAHLAGHEVAGAATALPRAELVITTTARLDAAHLPLLATGTVLADATTDAADGAGTGIDVVALAAISGPPLTARDGITRYPLKDGREVFLLAGGVSLAQPPLDALDLKVSVQALACHLLASGDLEPGVHAFPGGLDADVARARLAADGVRLGTPGVAGAC
jgi:adenosylhomocysteinase